MLLEVEIPAETFVTYATSERLLFVVGVHVKGQVVDLQKKLELSQDHLVFLWQSGASSYNPAMDNLSFLLKGSSINKVGLFF